MVVKENGMATWHDEMITKDEKIVMWPIIRPKLDENRTFTVEYRIVPGITQMINVTPGWNMISLYVKPRDTSITRYFENKPYRGIFTISKEGWLMTIKDSDVKNVTSVEPGSGYLIDSPENFTVEVIGKPVDLPYRVQLSVGWNLVGVPINESVKIEDITVNANHKRYTYSEAAEKGIISAFFWSYGSPDWEYLGQNEKMVPGKSYLVEAKSECRLEFN